VTPSESGMTGAFGREHEVAIRAATGAGATVRDLYERAATAIYAKADGSPVTDADLASDRIIHQVLSDQFPGDAILTEERADDATRLATRRCWIVDPIDGTEQFVRRTGEFDVLIGLVIEGRPVVAVGYQPTTQLLLAAVAGGGAWLRQGDDASLTPLHLPAILAGAPPRLATATWFGAPENLPFLTRVAARLDVSPPDVHITGFSPRLFVGDRRCDVMVGYRPATDHVMAAEWDFGVADLLIHEAGGTVTDLHGALHQYNKPVPVNRGGLVAAGDPATHARVLDALRAEGVIEEPFS